MLAVYDQLTDIYICTHVHVYVCMHISHMELCIYGSDVFWYICKCFNVWWISYLPLFVIIISVPIWWNCFQSWSFCNFTSAFGKEILGGITTCRGIGMGSIGGNGSVINIYIHMWMKFWLKECMFANIYKNMYAKKYECEHIWNTTYYIKFRRYKWNLISTITRNADVSISTLQWK